MELEELIVEIVIGLFLLFTSYQIGIKENITLLHGYHYTQLDPKDKKVFTKKIGIGTLLVSIGILVMPIINFAFYGAQRPPFCFRTAALRSQRPPIF